MIAFILLVIERQTLFSCCQHLANMHYLANITSFKQIFECLMNISFHKPCKLSRIQLWDLIKFAFVSCMIACSLCVGRSVWIECGQEESSASLETRDPQTLNSWFKMMLRFMHLPTVIFMSFSLCAVCKMSVTLPLFEKIWFPMHTIFPEYWVPCWLQCLLPF